MTAYQRNFTLDDISVRSGGDGRTVEAYAAAFDTPTRVVDQDGEYEETIDRTAFNKALGMARRSQGGWNIPVMFNHGMTIWGTPSERHSVPIGVPEDIRADGRGLYTRTRFHKSPVADEVLEAVKEGSIRAYSFAGEFKQSEPRVPRGGFHAEHDGTLRRVRRTASTLREFGPTPFAVYTAAEIVGVRAEQAVQFLNRLPAEEMERLLLMVRSGTLSTAYEAPEEQPPEVRSDEPASASEQPPPAEPTAHSERSLTPREAIAAGRAAFIIKRNAEEHCDRVG